MHIGKFHRAVRYIRNNLSSTDKENGVTIMEKEESCELLNLRKA